MDRYTLLAADTIEVADLYDIGDLYYGELNEDGERPVLRPESHPVLVLTTDYGRRYWLAAQYQPITFEASETLAQALTARGFVNLEGWIQKRDVYGSRAYENDGQADDVAWEAEHDRNGTWYDAR
jgi:hypothetical protein